MKLLFICGCLEPAKDGVGDYSRKLGASLIQRGWEVKILSINDFFVTTFKKEQQFIEGIPVSCYRFSAMTSLSVNIKRAKEIVQAFQPDWVSVQYVPFAFHHYGLHRLLGRQLRRLVAGAQVHLMMHELWVRNNTFKEFFWRLLQKTNILYFIHQLQPVVISSSIPLYCNEIRALGFSAVIPLPIFSNINPVDNKYDKIPNCLTVGIFSLFPPSLVLAAQVKELRQLATQQEKSFVLLLIGGNPEKAAALRCFLERHGSVVTGEAVILGRCSEDQVSLAIQRCDVGITTVDFNRLGKSGSTLAFLAHGIPVLASAITKKERYPTPFFSTEVLQSIYTKPCQVIKPGVKTVASAYRQLHLVENCCSEFEQVLRNVNTDS